jgi:hypothetical protein
MLMTAKITLQTPPCDGKNEMIEIKSKKKAEKLIVAACKELAKVNLKSLLLFFTHRLNGIG